MSRHFRRGWRAIGRDVRLDDPSDDLRFDGLVGVYQDVPGANQILPRNFGVRDAKLCIT
jgi:hypothetical protein